MAAPTALAARLGTPTGNVYYVDWDNGSDANDGLAETVGGGHGPWKTLDQPLKAVGSGGAANNSIVYVKQGSTPYVPAGTNHLISRSGGSSSAPTQICAYPGHSPIIRPNATLATGEECIKTTTNAAYWRIGPGLILERPGSYTLNRQPFGVGGAGGGVNASHDIEFVGNEIRDCQSASAIVTIEEAYRIHIIGNHIHNIGVSGTQFQGIYCMSDDSMIYNNWVHDLKQGFAIQIRTGLGQPSVGANRIVVAHNTIFDIRQDGGGGPGGGTGITFANKLQDCVCVNNIVYGCANRGIDGLNDVTTASTTSAGIANTTNPVTFTVGTITGTFPVSTPFYIRVDSEIMQVTNVAGTSWTANRAQLGSTAASHTSGASITHHPAEGNFGRKNVVNGNTVTQYSHSTATLRIINWDAAALSGGYTFGTGPGDNLTSDPLLVAVSVGSGDPHLQSGSPAIAYGLSAFTPSFDYYGNARITSDAGAVAATPTSLGWHGRGTP